MAMEIRCRIPDSHKSPILSVAFNIDRNEIYSGAQDAQIKVWDVESGKLLRVQTGHQAWVTDLLYCYAASILFSCSLDGNILVWSDKGKLLQMVDFGGPIHCLAWDTKGKNLIVGGRGVVQLFRCVRSSASLYIKSDSQNQKIGSAKFLLYDTFLLTHTDVVQGVCCSEKGNIFTAGFDKCICIFESAKPEDTILRISECHEGAISAVAYDRDSKSLVTGSYDGTLKIWSHEGHCLDILRSVTDCVTSIAYIPQTKCYWVTGKSRFPVIIDAMTTADVTNWAAETCSFQNLHLDKVFHAVDTDVAIGVTPDREIIVWRYNCFGPHRILQGHFDWVESVVVAERNPNKMKENGGTRNVASEPHTCPKSVHFSSSTTAVKLGQEDENRGRRRSSNGLLYGHGVPSKEVSGDGQGSCFKDVEIFTGGDNGHVLKWQTDRNSSCWAMSELAAPSSRSILCMLYHQDLDILITGSSDHKVQIWSLNDDPGFLVNSGPDILRGHTGKVTGLVVCKNGVKY